MATSGEVKDGYRIVPARDEATKREAYRLRYKVFVEELGETVEDASAETGIVEPEDETGHILLAYDGDEVVGTVAVDCWKDVELAAAKRDGLKLDRFSQGYARDSIFLGRKLAVRRSHRKTTLYLGLVAALTDFVAQAATPRFMFVSCRPEMVRMWEQLGARCYAPHFSLTAEQSSIPMCVVINDHDYLARVRSPLLEVIKKRGQPHLPEVARWFVEQWDMSLRPGEGVESLELFDLHGDGDEHATLAQSPLFAGLSEQDIGRFLAAGQKATFRCEERVIEKGDKSTDLFLIVKGYVEVIARRGGQEVVVATPGPGDVFGEMNMLLRSGRTTDVVALSDVETVRLSEATLTGAMPETAAKVNLNLAKILAWRLQFTTSLVS